MESVKRKPGPAKGYKHVRGREVRGETKGTPNVPAWIKGNGMRGAWQRGYTAAMAKVRADANPYQANATSTAVQKTKTGEIRRTVATYERGMHRMWADGWMAAVRHMAGRD